MFCAHILTEGTAGNDGKVQGVERNREEETRARRRQTTVHDALQLDGDTRNAERNQKRSEEKNQKITGEEPHRPRVQSRSQHVVGQNQQFGKHVSNSPQIFLHIR